MKYIKDALMVWGCICLACTLMFLIRFLFLDGESPLMIFTDGPTGMGEWLGMGLIWPG